MSDKEKPVKLRITWSKKDQDLLFHYPNRPDGHLMHIIMHSTPIAGGKTLREELVDRGYNIETLKFSIERKPKE